MASSERAQLLGHSSSSRKKVAKLSSQDPQRVSESVKIMIGWSRRKKEVVTFLLQEFEFLFSDFKSMI